MEMTKELAELNAAVERMPQCAEVYITRGKYHYGCNSFGAAINDFNRALECEPGNTEAKEFLTIIQEILEFRYKDIYNP